MGDLDTAAGGDPPLAVISRPDTRCGRRTVCQPGTDGTAVSSGLGMYPATCRKRIRLRSADTIELL
jgi:hypothetical protein